MPDILDNVKDSILLFHTGQNRKSGKIQEGFKKLSDDQLYYLDSLKKLTRMALRGLPVCDPRTFGELLNWGWLFKKESNKGVSTREIDELFSKAKVLGSLGAKILGSGGGGYCIFVVEPKNQKEFIKKIGLKHIPYRIDYKGLNISVK